MSPTYDDLQQSYGRCLRDKQFIERFYEIFLASSPEVEAAFATTDFQTQRLALRRGISVAILHASGSDIVGRTVGKMAQVHSRGGRCPVRPDLYPLWVDSMMKAVRESDPQADDALIGRWREAMGSVAESFVARF